MSHPSTSGVPSELETIDRLSEEFFSSFTTNTRKREIELSLDSWIRSLPNCWEKTFYIFQLSSSLYTKTICLSLLQDFLNKNWYLVPSPSRTQFYESVFKYLLSESPGLSHNLRNKLCQIVVFTVGQDWPEHSPTFLSSILQLLNFKSRSTYEVSISLAVNLIKLIVEELPTNFHRYQLFQITKDEFVDRIQGILPGILEKLSMTIESVLKIQIDVMNSTPPPSPTGSSNGSSINVTKIPNLERLFGSISEMDCEVIELLTSISQCVESIIEFMAPGNIQHLSKALLSSLGFFATAALLKPNDNLQSLAHSSMNCINQLLEKEVNFDTKIEYMINEICQYFFVFLKTNIKVVFEGSNGAQGSEGPEDIDHELAKKMIEFMKHSMKFQFERFKQNPSFSPESFLSLLFQLTEKMFRLDLACYLDCLDIWDHYFAYYHSKTHELSQNPGTLDQNVFVYTEFILTSLQYSIHRNILARIDDKEMDSEGLTMMDRFLTQTTDSLLQICSLYPGQGTLYVFDTYFSNKLNQLRNAISAHESSLISLPGQVNLQKVNGFFVAEPLLQLQLSLMDFGLSLRVCSTLLPNYNQTFDDSRQVNSRIEMAFRLICDILKFIEDRQYTVYKDGFPINPLFPEFLSLKTEILSTFRGYHSIFQGLFESPFPPDILYEHCCSIVCDIHLVGRLPVEFRAAQAKLYHCSAMFLSSLTTSDRRQMIYSQPCFERLCSQDFFDKFLVTFDLADKGQAPCNIPIRDKVLILNSIINCLVLPFEKVPPEGQLWQSRQTVLNTFVGKYFQLFNNLTLNDAPRTVQGSMTSDADAQKCPNVFCESLYVMKCVIEKHNGSNSKGKQIFFDALKEPLESFISLLANRESLYSSLAGTQIVAHIFGLFYAVFDVLFKQFPEGFFLSIVNSCIQIINAFQILTPDVDLGKESPQKVIAALEVALQFVKLLTLAVKMTKFKYRDLLVNILEFLTQQVFTSLVKDKSPVSSFLFQQSGMIFEIYSRFCRVFYDAFKETLLWNSGYFFPVSGAKVRDDSHELYFQRIMEIFGQSFSHPENLQTFKQNIGILDFLNTTISVKIFSRPAFQQAFLEPFLLLFLRVTQEQSLKLLEEDLFSLIYQLASVDFTRFQCVIVPKFIAGYSLPLEDCKALEASFCKSRNGVIMTAPPMTNGRPMMDTTAAATTMIGNNNIVNHGDNSIDLFAFSKLLFQLFTDIRFCQHHKSANKAPIMT